MHELVWHGSPASWLTGIFLRVHAPIFTSHGGTGIQEVCSGQRSDGGGARRAQLVEEVSCATVLHCRR